MTHLVAKADRTQNWASPQQQVVAIDKVRTFIDQQWHGRSKPENYRIGTWELFQEGLTESKHLQCMRRRGDQDVTILIIDQDEMFNG
jgi:hypothetical protein